MGDRWGRYDFVTKTCFAQFFLLVALNSVGVFLTFTSKRTAIVNGAYIAFCLVPTIIIVALMNSLFEFARVIESDKDLDVKEVNICNVLRDALSESYSEFETRGFTVEASIPDAPEMRLCNEDALRRVLQNLLKNACVHGKEYIHVRLEDGGTIEVANKADFLAQLDIESLFERFYTSDASRTSKNTGLGLAIAKELTERMGAQITASVEGELFVARVRIYN